MKWLVMFLVASAASVVGSAVSDTFICGFIAGVLAHEVNTTVDRSMA